MNDILARFDELWGEAPPDSLKGKKGAEIKQFIVEVLAAERERNIKIIEELKTDERKVSVFGKGMDSWEARTYDEKMLVNAALQVAIKRIKSPTTVE